MKRHFFMILMVCVFIALSGCGQEEASVNKNGSAVEPQAPQADEMSEQANGKTTYPLTITDAAGVELNFEQAPERIVSTSPAETEILYALGLGEQIVAVSDYCDYPEEAKNKPKLGSVRTPNIEKIIELSPDLIIGGISLSEESVGKVRELGFKIYKVEPKTIDEVMLNILEIGKITDRQKEAEQLVAKMKSEIQIVTDAVKDLKEEEKKKVFIEFSPGWTVGKGEFMHEMVELSGAINIAADMEGWNKIDPEKVIQDNPDVILYPAGLLDKESDLPLEQVIQSRMGWASITAIQNNDLHALSKDKISRPGPRITEALVDMAKAIYPDLVK